jgi:hypothetical protein
MADVNYSVILKANPTATLDFIRFLKENRPSLTVTIDKLPVNLLTGATVITVTAPHTYRNQVLAVMRAYLGSVVRDWK